MESHPIPQNVTSFQFRLIGDMTLKQFVYLAAGVGTAYMIFVFLASVVPLLAWPLIVIFSFFGIAYAFIPYADRPMDHWTKAFLKAIYSPTQRVWTKNGKMYNQEPTFAKRLDILTQKMAEAAMVQKMQREAAVVASAQPQLTPTQPTMAKIQFYAPSPTPASATPIPSMPVRIQPTPQPPQPARPSPQPMPPTPQEVPSSEELAKEVELAKQAQAIQSKIIESERKLNQIKLYAQSPHVDPKTYTRQVNEILDELRNLMERAAEIKKQLALLTEESPESEQKHIVKVEPEPEPPKPRRAQVALTTFPNVINGIVVDTMGEYLENVVVVIYDKEGIPVRASKTNKLGQFTGSTPLPDGTYTIELEKENLVFDSLQIDLSGKVLPPLTIAAKRPISDF